MKGLGIVSVLFLLGCNEQTVERYNNFYKDATTYKITVDRTTPLGIGLDDPSRQVTDISVDLLAEQVQDCLKYKHSTCQGSHCIVQLNEQEASNGQCISNTFNAEINWDWVQVKIPQHTTTPEPSNGRTPLVDDGWYTSSCTSRQLFLCNDPGYCTRSSSREEGECGCNCNGAIQDNQTLILTPNLLAFKEELIRLVSGCNNVFIEPLKQCLNM